MLLVFLSWGMEGCKKNEITPEPLVKLDSVAINKGVTVEVSQDTTTVFYGNVRVRFTATSTCFPGTEVFTFRATGVNFPAGGFYLWNWGDGNTAKGDSVRYSFPAAGSFVVKLWIMADENTPAASLSFPVKANGRQTKPEASFSAKFDFPDNLNYVTFNSTSSVNQGDFVSYRYQWGDGKEYLGSVGLVRHEFPRAIFDSTYRVKLTVMTNTGCTADTTVPVLVPGRYNIRGSFRAEALNACTDETIRFTAEAENVPGNAIYEWDFSDGTGTYTGNPITYRYRFPNDYDVIMRVKLGGRTIYSTHKMVPSKGRNPKPTAKFETKLAWENATIRAYSFNSESTIPTSTIDEYRWDFGDGNSNNSFLAFLENRYARASTDRTYTVQLIVRGNGCYDTARQTVLVPKL